MSPSDLDQPVLASLVGIGFATAFLHAALPTHWLPFVLVGRAQDWRLARAVGVAALAAAAHIGSTTLVGGLIVAAGLTLEQWVSGLLPYVAAAFLLGFGLFYLGRSVHRWRVAEAVTAAPAPRPGPHRAAALGLIAMLAVSPGEVLLPFYLNAAPMGWGVLALLTLVFLLGTVAGMVLLTGLAYAGASLIRIERFARYEGMVLGLALIGLSLLLILAPH